MRCSYQNKVSYYTKTNAKDAMRGANARNRTPKPFTNVYSCGKCGGWHLTTQVKETAA